MAIVNEYTEVRLDNSTISYYESLGYKIPRSKDKDGRLRVPRGTTIKIKTSDLLPSSNQYIDVECDCCHKKRKLQYHKYNQNIQRNHGLYICDHDTKHKDFKNGISFESVINSIKSFYSNNDRFPKYNEYTTENGFNCSYSKIISLCKQNNTTLQDELSKIDCTKSIANEKYYDQYIEKFKKYIINHDSIDLYSLSRTQEYKNTGLPNIRWFINHCPDKTVKSNDGLKRWMGLYTRVMTKEECKDIILNMSKCYDRPLMYDDFRGSGYGKVTVGQINKYWGSLNKMKKDLGLEINIESMIDRQISSKEELDNMILDICNFVKSENRNFITTREINERPEWVNITSLHKSCKKFYGVKLQDLLLRYDITLGKQGVGITFDFDDGEHITSQFEYMFSKYLRDNGLVYNKDYKRDVKYSTFISEYTGNMNCDYVIEINNKTIYIEIAGILAEYKTWFYDNKSINKKSKENYRLKLQTKEEMLKSHNLIYFILFPCDLTKSNFKQILNDSSLELKKEIENFNQNNIDWVKIREVGELDYSKPFLRDTRPKKKEVA